MLIRNCTGEFVVIGTSQLSSVGGLLLNHGSVADESSYDV
jgi:hypothetical protein